MAIEEAALALVKRLPECDVEGCSYRATHKGVRDTDERACDDHAETGVHISNGYRPELKALLAALGRPE